MSLALQYSLQLWEIEFSEKIRKLDTKWLGQLGEPKPWRWSHMAPLEKVGIGAGGRPV